MEVGPICLILNLNFNNPMLNDSVFGIHSTNQVANNNGNKNYNFTNCTINRKTAFLEFNFFYVFFLTIVSAFLQLW